MENISFVTLGALITIVISVLAFKRDTKKDIQDDTSITISVKEEIKYISKGVEDIKYDTRNLMSSFTDMNNRLIRVEETAKIMDRRMTIIEEKERN